MNFEFLYSERFWKLVLIGLSAALEEYTRTHKWEMALLAFTSVTLGGSVAVRTTDRFSEKLGGENG